MSPFYDTMFAVGWFLIYSTMVMSPCLVLALLTRKSRMDKERPEFLTKGDSLIVERL